MATVADELLNDFEDSGSENEEEQNGDFFNDAGEGFDGVKAEVTVKREDGGMELEDDEEQPDEADLDVAAPSHLKMEDAEDEAETKARVEKMELKTVSDVRSVAGLMKQLEPVIEVSPPVTSYACNNPFTSLVLSHPNFSAASRKSNITRAFRQISRRRTLVA